MWTGKPVQENDGRDFRKQGLYSLQAASTSAKYHSIG